MPEQIRDDFARAKRLEWQTLFWMGTVVLAMFVTMGGSQAMRSALIEDALSLVPSLTFLIAARVEPRDPTEKYPFGFVRVNSLAFLVAAVALSAVGGFLMYESAMTLLMAEHPTVAPVEVFGHTVWLGWLMIAALAYSVVVPMILGRMKLPVAGRLRDKVLHTDALMQKADWQTGLAGMIGVLGIYFGYWWADSAAALFIAFSILRDGVTNMGTAAAELLDGAPRELGSSAISEEAKRLQGRLERLWPEGKVRLRESGRYIVGTVEGVDPPADPPKLEELMGDDPSWRLARLSFSPPETLRREDVG
ncbi:cation diffusion facilitator family transporter [Pelagerythrobacter rhizovicinus]|uniref:Cation diffusion facilitator family transporter n=1 Tax=Pelagerythrobacter rhizovicinus TaxID=2268576 RepID=A0A4Q2KP85_9SPHN|nr:cation diffusion facilitator family transporter [Pelagerythrobacter rhizovicinus]RXZ65051.1 cation diffusion facilitator family transporter [Pelagerythrobacter rhizovicinus]